MKKSTSTKQTKASKPDKPDKPTKGSKRPCPSGFYRNKKGICVQASIGPDYQP